MFEKFKNEIIKLSSLTKEDLKKIQDRFLKQSIFLCGILLISYTAAAIVGAASIPLIMPKFTKSGINKHNDSVQISSISLQNRPNFHKIKKDIKERNIFNIDGEYPKEDVKKAIQTVDKNIEDFDESAACVPTTLNIKLIGTIELGVGKSIATIQEKGISESDIYKVGESIIGHEDTRIVSIERNRVVINNSGNKECIMINDEEFLKGREVYIEAPNSEQNTGGETQIVELSAKYVEKELGDGFSKIIQSARLVPHTQDNKVMGFKIFGIQKGTLLDQIGLQNGDIINQVNETVLEPENGFALYQALMDEKEVAIKLMRKGITPKVLRVFIK